MPRRIRSRRAVAAIVLLLASGCLLSACGSASSGSGQGQAQAQALLRQTFTAAHPVRSGVLDFALSLTPSGSQTISTPITLSLGGPFQSRGAGRLPASALQFTIDGLGHRGQLGIVSTGSRGYVTLGATGYRLPPSTFQKLASSFSSAAAGGGSGALAKLGIDPLHWLTQPTVVGTDTVGGASTAHIRAHVNVAALLGDLNNFLAKTQSTAGAAGLSTAISPASRRKIAASVRHATVEVWTGSADHTLRKLSVNLVVPVTGQISTQLGGLNQAAIAFTLQYAGLNQPQTITAPSTIRPFSGFTDRIKGIVAELRSAFGAGAFGGGASGSGGAGSTGSAGKVNGYSNCLQRAGGDVSKMQRCAALLGGG